MRACSFKFCTYAAAAAHERLTEAAAVAASVSTSAAALLTVCSTSFRGNFRLSSQRSLFNWFRAPVATVCVCVPLPVYACVCVCVSFAPAACGTPNCSCRQLRLKFLINTKEKPLQVFHHHQVAPFFPCTCTASVVNWNKVPNEVSCLFWFIGTPQVSNHKHTCKLYSNFIYVHMYMYVYVLIYIYICICACAFLLSMCLYLPMWPTPVARVPYPRYVIHAIWP